MKISKFLLVFMLIFAGIAVKVRYNQLIEEEKRYVEQLGGMYAERFKAILCESLYMADYLEGAIVGHNGKPPMEFVETLYKHVHEPEIHHSILYIPNGVIEFSYPIEHNANYLGYNVLTHERTKADAEQVVQRGNFTFASPYTAADNTSQIALHNPVFIDKNGNKIFWGFISISSIHPREILRADETWSLEKNNCEYTLQAIYNGGSTEKYSTPMFEPDETSTNVTFGIENAMWSLDLYRPEAVRGIRLHTGLIAFTYTAVAILLFLMFRHFELRIHRTYAASLIDPLTKLGNKKGLHAYEEDEINNSDSAYTIFYLDLNLFKPVNDTYGHHIGDALLKSFGGRLRNQFKKNTYIARNGGDEFVIIIPKALGEADCEKIKKRIMDLAASPFTLEGYTIFISSSVGYACYPKDGKNFEEVLVKADQHMFESKEQSQEEDR